MSKKGLSLCMIVRDEAEMLPDFLQAASGVWDELCVVDTGSKDKTVALLQAAGARVASAPWQDDFAAARNASLDMATGEWILVLDADERLSPLAVSEIRALIADPTVGAATLLMRNPLPGGHQRLSHLLRLFRSHPTVRYEFPIHEDLSRPLAAQLADSGRRLAHLTGVTEHLGYVRTVAAARGKRDRDTRILRTCVGKNPRDLYSWFKLLEVTRFWGDKEALATIAREAEGVLKAAGPRALATSHFGGELIVLLAQGLFADDAAGALRFVDSWVGRVPDSAPLMMRRGEMHEAAKDPASAASDFQRCLQLAGTTADVQFATVRPLLGLSRLALSAGDLTRAWRHTQDAIDQAPRDQEALALTLFICRLARGPGGIEDFLAAYISAYGDNEDMRQAVAYQRALAPRTPDKASGQSA